MKIYVASSWRNEQRQQLVVRTLRDEGHTVYDFRNPSPGDTGFGWRQCATADQLRSPRAFRDEVLTHPIAKAGFMKDMSALEAADATVLVLPCGRSAHLELGWAAGHGRRTVVLLDDPISEPELMYLACSDICVSIEDVVRVLKPICDHGVTFDPVAARRMEPRDVRARWPRGFFTAENPCKKCGYCGIFYASAEHYFYGDW